MPKKKSNTPKRKRLNRKARLIAGLKWIESYNGEHLVKGYNKWFGIDKLCAIAELRMLDMHISEEYEKQVKRAMSNERRKKEERKEEKLLETQNFEGEPWCDEIFSYIAGYTSNSVP